MDCVNMHVLNGLWAGIDELAWLCVWNMIGWLVEYRHEMDMHDKSMVGLWSMVMVWVGRNSMTLLVSAHDGASCNGRNSTKLLVKFCGGALAYIIK